MWGKTRPAVFPSPLPYASASVSCAGEKTGGERECGIRGPCSLNWSVGRSFGQRHGPAPKSWVALGFAQRPFPVLKL
ncbi:hypothetical protein IE53DRAFT_388443 [Violaceomyces palustris]|uniref:Uncharacterized protein n=1 Tax=Violaceomyces palustris TaxID=1673888 RepID=A0ACD0NU56_9BASI|nr:hypothetical protein IE53DRAFT_388443 [Violaceomyces palustris]